MTTVLGLDSLVEANAGVTLTNHTPSGTGATGGPWVKCSNYSDHVSLAGGGFVGNGGGAANSLPATSIANNNTVKATLKFGSTYCACGVALWADNSGDNGYVFYWEGFVNQWQVAQYTPGNGGPSLGTISAPAPVIGTAYTLELDRVLNNGVNTLTASINGAVVGTFTDSAHTGNLTAGLRSYTGSNTTYTNFEADNSGGTPPPPPSYKANIFCHGNSLTYGYDPDLPGGGPVATPYPATLAAALPGYNVGYRGIPGYTFAQLLADFATGVQPHFMPGIPNIVVVEAFWNDAIQGGSESSILSGLQAYVANARANNWKVVTKTPTAGYYLADPGSPPPVTQESVRQQVLANILTGVPSGEYGDAATWEGFDAKYGNQAFCQTDSTLWSSDHLHFNQAGYTGLAPFAQVGILQCLNP